MLDFLPAWIVNFLPILGLLVLVALLIMSLPKVELGHSQAFMRRRFFNWFPLGLTYAFLYMGRYNLTVAKNALGDLMTNEDFGIIFSVGTITYGLSFLINGPLTDRIGGRKTILIAAAGASAMNIAMGLLVDSGATEHLTAWMAVLYALNMYFQSFGAVSIVKVNASWFHVRERGVFGGIFGILISLGIYFAFDWGRLIVEAFPTEYVFYIPAMILAGFFVVDYLTIRDRPGLAGHLDFDTADASSGDDGPPLSVAQVLKKMATNPVLVTIALIEFCSGYLRNAIMHWYIIFAKHTGIMDSFVPANWGLLLCAAGITGGVFAGVISDRVFHSRRGPSAGILYAAMVLGSAVAIFAVTTPAIGWIVVFMSLCIIGVHGMLSGTASMDFGGRKNVGIAVGIIDGLVYLGTGTQAILLGFILPEGPAAKDASAWWIWPVAMLPIAIVGFLLTLRIWHAKPKAGGPAAH
jgi:OPA family glycerol-3-phosphate transporter-like MFS transporter